MNAKVFFILTLLIAVQTVMSCDPCACRDSVTYEKLYVGINVRVYDTSSLQKKSIGQPVFRDAFGMTVTNISSLRSLAGLSCSFGFNQLNACDCIDEIFVYPDPIERISIILVDDQMEAYRDMTHQFGIYGYGGEVIPVDDFFYSEKSGMTFFNLS